MSIHHEALITAAPQPVFELLEVVPGQRVAQAWRFGATHPTPWEPGVYSTLRFALEPAGDGTRLVIDHTGIPPEWIEHISGG